MARFAQKKYIRVKDKCYQEQMVFGEVILDIYIYMVIQTYKLKYVVIQRLKLLNYIAVKCALLLFRATKIKKNAL